MNNYESVIIIKENTDKRKINGLKTRIKNKILKQNGKLIEFIDLGIKILAYEIKGNKKGYYLGVDFKGTLEIANNLEKLYQKDENILKFITVKMDDFGI